MRIPTIVRNAFTLITAQVMVVIIGFGIKKLQTQYLGPELYGYYAFFSSFIGISLLLFRFGFFSSLQVLYAQSNSKEETSALSGVGLIVSLVVGLCFALFVFVMGFFIDEVFNVEVGAYLQALSPLLIFLPWRNVVNSYALGTEHVSVIARFDYISKILFIIGLSVLVAMNKFGLVEVMAFNVFSTCCAVLATGFMMPISFQDLRSTWLLVWNKTKSYGFAFYSGAVINQSVYRLDELFITYFKGATLTGFYTLAGLLCSPMMIFSQNIANSLYKRFNRSRRIPFQVFVVLFVGLLLYVAFLYVASDWAVAVLLGEEYRTVAQLTIWLSGAYFLQGMYQPFMFLSAKSKGIEIRNVAILEAIASIAGNIVLIPIFGVLGAIATSICAKLIHLVGMIYHYRIYLKEGE